MSLWQQIQEFFGKEPPCPHLWKPCVVKLVAWSEYKPAERCSLCKDWRTLTEAQFYQKYGENLFVMAKAAYMTADAQPRPSSGREQ